MFRWAVGTTGTNRRGTAPTTLICTAAVPMFLCCAVRTTCPIARRIAELTLLFVTSVLMLFCRAVGTAGSETGRIAVPAFAHEYSPLEWANDAVEETYSSRDSAVNPMEYQGSKLQRVPESSRWPATSRSASPELLPVEAHLCPGYLFELTFPQ